MGSAKHQRHKEGAQVRASDNAHQTAVKIRLGQVLLEGAPEPISCKGKEDLLSRRGEDQDVAQEPVEEKRSVDRDGQGKYDFGACPQLDRGQAESAQGVPVREVAGQNYSPESHPGVRMGRLPTPDVE